MGGPILDHCGNVAGITVLGFYESFVRQAASAADVLAVMRTHGLDVSRNGACID
jgi:hypothetical protein